MEIYNWCLNVTMIEIIFFALVFFTEKFRINMLEDKEEKTQKLNHAKNIFHAFTNISIVITILAMIPLLEMEWHLFFLLCYAIYFLMNTIISIFENLKNGSNKKYIILKLTLICVFALGVLRVQYWYDISSMDMALKPIIYIYPETETTVQVSVGYPEKLSCVYPEYNKDGWEVIAKPNGDLIDQKTGRNLYCLYWEGNQKAEYKFKDGFVVSGEDSAKFLEEKLAILGLNEREANEFIIYWLPKLESNKYNLIRFETMKEIEEYMPLNIEPKPDSLIRISMNFKDLNRPIEIEEQKLETVVREGYTVVEWGGSEF